MKGNKGEWSEIYTFLQILNEGKLFAADKNLNKIEDVFYQVKGIKRAEKNYKREYILDEGVKVINPESSIEICKVSIEDIGSKSAMVLREIRSNYVGRTFEIPEVEEFARSIDCNSLKAKTIDKADIILSVKDSFTGKLSDFGFSIKSYVGGPPTLFNASKSTNVSFLLSGNQLSENEITILDSYKRYKDKISYLNNKGINLEYSGISSMSMLYNLKIVDTSMDVIIANMLLDYYSGRASDVSDLTVLLSRKNPLSICKEDALSFYSYKVKELLTNIALGMVPGKIWTGRYDATGGFIIVKQNGELLCYHIYNRNEFRDYLFNHTKLDTPDRKKHSFGNIYNKDGRQFIDLNLQIRFKQI